MKIIIALVISFTSSFALALIDTKNANYSSTWTDAEVPGVGYDLKVVRTYNSKSLFDGIFGYGWCSDFETRLTFTPEGNIKMQICGAGQETLFSPREFGRKDIDRTIAEIIKSVKAAGRGTSKDHADLAAAMVSDHDLRAKFASAYKVSVPVQEGSKYYANGNGVEYITFAKGVYTRSLQDGSSMRFDNKGYMTHMYDKNGNFLKLAWENDLLKEVSDNNGRKLNFNYANGKKVRFIKGPNNLNVEYKYKGLVDLNYVKNALGQVFTYDYDDAHNLTNIAFPDKTTIVIGYNQKEDWVTSFKDRDNCLESYSYEFNKKTPKLHFWADITKTCNKEIVNSSKHEFWYAERADGQLFLRRVLSKVNTNITDISYHEQHGKPVSIRRNSDVANFEYTDSGLVKSKRTEFAVVTFEYKDSNFPGKVTLVKTDVINAQKKVTATRTSEFSYDKKGNLEVAKNSDGLFARMTYDLKGRIETITDQSKKVLQLAYNEQLGKPNKVTRPGLGSIVITYKANGDMDKLTSPEGESVAMQVASIFNNFLEVTAPATAEVFGS